jgi:hypothetical protein
VGMSRLPGWAAVAACLLVAGCHGATGARAPADGDVVPSSAPYTANCGEWSALSVADKKLALLRLYRVYIDNYVVFASAAPIPHYIIHMTAASNSAGVAEVDAYCHGKPTDWLMGSLPFNFGPGKALPPGIVLGDPQNYSSKSSFFSANP